MKCLQSVAIVWFLSFCPVEVIEADISRVPFLPTRACLSGPDVTLRLRRRYYPLDMPEVVCSNGLPGVEGDDVCCSAQCETCGGSGCRNREGGAVR